MADISTVADFCLEAAILAIWHSRHPQTAELSVLLDRCCCMKRILPVHCRHASWLISVLQEGFDGTFRPLLIAMQTQNCIGSPISLFLLCTFLHQNALEALVNTISSSPSVFEMCQEISGTFKVKQQADSSTGPLDLSALQPQTCKSSSRAS